jgi:hypothetical protein
VRRVIGVILIGLGVFSVSLATLLSLYVAPKLIAAPVDTYEKTTMQGGNGTYFDVGTFQTRTGATITATNTVRGDVKASSDKISVYDSYTMVEDLAAGKKLQFGTDRIAFDRRTSQQVHCCNASIGGDTSVRPTGIGIVWPIGVSKKTYQVYDTSTKQAWPARYEGTDTVHGMTAYRFVQHIPDTKVGDQGLVPGDMLGLPKGSPNVDAGNYYQSDVTFWIDPRTGSPVNQEQQVHSELRTADGKGKLVTADFDLKMVDANQRHLVDGANANALQMMLLRIVGPLTAGTLGLILVAVGAFLTVRRSVGRRHAA